MTFTATGVTDITTRLYETISPTWKPDYVVGMSDDGIVPALQLSKMFKVPLRVLHTDTSDCVMSEDAHNFSRNILVVTGNNDRKIVKWLKSDWKQGCLPHSEKWKDVWGNNVRIACLQSSGNDRDYDYVGVTGKMDFYWNQYTQ